MNHLKVNLDPGLWFVGVPIGAARDITLRALDVLANADLLAAEDTRSLRKLLDIHGVPLAGRRIVAIHDHTSEHQLAQLIDRMKPGESLAYASEAGMPLIADPGFELARAARARGVKVNCAPGPSAVLTALSLAGLPTDAFYFGGFLPSAKAARRAALKSHAQLQATLVFFESPKRCGEMLRDAVDIFGPERPGVVCRELTKKFETVDNGPLVELMERYEKPPKGEIVILIGRASQPVVNQATIDAALKDALREMSIKDAAAFVSDALDQPKRELYQRALELRSPEE